MSFIKSKPAPPAPDPLALAPLPTLWEDPEYMRVSAELAALNERFAVSDKRLRSAQKRARGVPTNTSNSARAASLLKGAMIFRADPKGEIEAAEEEQKILGEEIGKKHAEIADIKGRFSADICRSLMEEHREAVLDSYFSACAMAEAFAKIFEMHDRIRAAGGSFNPSILVDYYPDFARACGQIELTHSGLREWANWMKKHNFPVEVENAKY